MKNALLRTCLIFLPFAGAAIAEEQIPPAVTQAVPGMKRTPLERLELRGTNLELMTVRVEFAPNLEVPLHTHPGEELTYVLEGSLTYFLADGVAKDRKAGESLALPAGTVHGAKVGENGAVLIGTFLLEKGKPFMAIAEPPDQKSP